jgi:hypothetical protein
LKACPELEEKLVAQLGVGPDDSTGEAGDLLDPFQYTAAANYVVPMLLDLAIDHGNEVVEAVPRYSSLDHAANWSSLLSAVARFDDFLVPYFNRREATDPFAEELLRFESNRLGRQHALASFEQGLWSLVEDEEGLRVHLAPRARRSALHLVANKADFLAADPTIQQGLRDPNGDMESFTLTLGTNALSVLRESCPDAWSRLVADLPFRIDILPFFRAFVIRLSRSGPRWLTRDTLWRYWAEFSADRTAPAIDRDEWDALVNFNAVTPEEGLEWGLQAAFIRFGETFAAWPFVFHVLHPDLNFLTLLFRRYNDLWSRTIGADLALVADRMAARMPDDGRFIARARRKRKGVGEADLAILDRATGDVMVLELKTVFDRFRTHAQLSNFTEQRVNFDKAIVQARRAADAIRDGDWSLRDLFGKEAPTSPSIVTPALLTWWDTYNPTLGSDDSIICSNFACFEYLLAESTGLPDLVSALEELPRLYCPAVLRPEVALLDGENVPIRREVQTDLLPSLELGRLNRLTRAVLADLPQLPPDPQLQEGASPEEIPIPYS